MFDRVIKREVMTRKVVKTIGVLGIVKLRSWWSSRYEKDVRMNSVSVLTKFESVTVVVIVTKKVSELSILRSKSSDWDQKGRTNEIRG